MTIVQGGLLNKVENLLGSHLYWTKVFAALEQNTVKDVYYSSFAAAENGDVLMAAIGKDYKSLARQLLVLQNAKEFVRDVAIVGGRAEIAPNTVEILQVQFTVKLKLNPEIFLITFRKE